MHIGADLTEIQAKRGFRFVDPYEKKTILNLNGSVWYINPQSINAFTVAGDSLVTHRVRKCTIMNSCVILCRQWISCDSPGTQSYRLLWLTFQVSEYSSSGLMVSMLDSGSKGLGFSSGWGHLVVFLVKGTLLSQCLSPLKRINVYQQTVRET